MSRLIDADALMDYVLNLKGKMIGCNDIARFPTAYDTDKVIEQLEAEMQKQCVTACFDDGYEQEIYDAYRQGMYDAFTDAIEIVKKGGKNEI